MHSNNNIPNLLNRANLFDNFIQIIQQIFMKEPRAHFSPHFYYHQIQPKQSTTKIQVDLYTDAITISRRSLTKLKKGDQNGNLKFKNRDWINFDMRQVVKQIKQWNIEKGLYIESAKQITIINQISHIEFYSLQSLNLSGNNIESIESLCYLNAPNLQRLILSQNKITCIKSLRKISLPHLIKCSLGSNRVLDYSPFCQFQGTNMKQIYQEHRADPGLCNTFTWIAKLNTIQLQRLWVSSDNRIWQKKAQNALQRRYLKRKQITFYVGFINDL